MRGAEKENIDDMREFDDEGRGNEEDGEGAAEDEEDEGDDPDASGTSKKKPAKKEKDKGKKDKEEEKEEEDGEEEDDFAAWNTEVGPDIGALEARLNPVQRYALKFRTDIDPFRSLYFLSEEQRRREAEEDQVGDFYLRTADSGTCETLPYLCV